LSGHPYKTFINSSRFVTEAGVRKISSGMLPEGTVLMSSRAPIGYLIVTSFPLSVNQGFIAFQCDKGMPNHYLLHWLEDNMAKIKGLGSGATFPEVSKAKMKPLPVLFPTQSLLADFESQVTPAYVLAENLLKQNQNLAKQRDRLLPRLINGTVSAPSSGASGGGEHV